MRDGDEVLSPTPVALHRARAQQDRRAGKRVPDPRGHVQNLGRGAAPLPTPRRSRGFCPGPTRQRPRARGNSPLPGTVPRAHAASAPRSRHGRHAAPRAPGGGFPGSWLSVLARSWVPAAEAVVASHFAGRVTFIHEIAVIGERLKTERSTRFPNSCRRAIDEGRAQVRRGAAAVSMRGNEAY